MNTVQAAQRLSRNLVFETPGKATAGQLQELAECLTQAIDLFYELAPPIYRRTTISAQVGGSKTVMVNVADGATEASSGAPFMASDRGKSVVFSDHGIHNEIVSTTGWLDPYRGAGGSVSATVWDDVVLFNDTSFERIVSEPKRMTDGVRLVRDDDLNQHCNLGSRWDRGTGEPTRYALDPVGDTQSGESDPLAILRVDPIPAAPLTIRMDVDISSVRYGVGAMVRIKKGLPMTERDVVSIVLPLAREYLADGGLWDETKGMTAEAARRMGNTARLLATRKPAYLVRPRHRVGTPAGY